MIPTCLLTMVSCQKGPTRHAYAWQIRAFWQETLDKWHFPTDGCKRAVEWCPYGRSDPMHNKNLIESDSFLPAMSGHFWTCVDDLNDFARKHR